MHRAVLLLLAASSVGLRAPAQPPGEGCYRADRTLGTSASAPLVPAVPSAPGRALGGDSAALARLAAFRLLAGGRVERPGTVMRDWWAIGSGWERAGDSLRVRLSTAASGWALRLAPTPEGGDSTFVGEAVYISDAIPAAPVAGWPPRVPVLVRREPCAPPA